MPETNTPATSKRIVSLIKIIIYLLLVLFFLFELTIALAPHQKLTEYKQQISSDSLFNETYDSIWSYSEFHELVKEKTFKEALLVLSDNDSIQLVINIPDSLVCLYINGVKIHQTKVNKIETDLLLKKLNVMQYVYLFSKPLSVNSQYATIVKEPIVVRQAPKDTAEAANNAYKPDTLIQNPAFLELRLEYEIDLILEQEIKPNTPEAEARKEFYNTLGGNKYIAAFKRFVYFKKQEYRPTITIILPANDLRAIYRALPQKSFVIIKL
jgi:hypothetical protein